VLRGPELHRRSPGYAYHYGLRHHSGFEPIRALWSGLYLFPIMRVWGICRLVSTPPMPKSKVWFGVVHRVSRPEFTEFDR
jgi:hypothetical protein